MRTRVRPGFTLLEAVVALTIVSVTAISALAATAAELRTAERSRRMLEAVALARQRLAAVEMLPPREAGLLPDSLARGKFAEPFDTYRWSAATGARFDLPAMFDATVRVEWDGGSYSLTERLYRPAPKGLAP